MWHGFQWDRARILPYKAIKNFYPATVLTLYKNYHQRPSATRLPIPHFLLKNIKFYVWENLVTELKGLATASGASPLTIPPQSGCSPWVMRRWFFSSPNKSPPSAAAGGTASRPCWVFSNFQVPSHKRTFLSTSRHWRRVPPFTLYRAAKETRKSETF